MSAVRAIHRISASTVLVLAAVMGLMARGPAPRLHAAGRSALLLLALALGLSALGIVTPGSRAGGVLLGNLLGGFLMLAVSWSLVLRLKTPPALQESPWLRVGAGAAVLLWLVQAALGALSGAGGHAAASWLHVLLGMVAAAGALALGALAYRRGRRGPGMALMLLATLQPMLGAAAAILLAPPALVLIHNASAALGLALLLGLAVPGGRAVPSRRSGEP
jgi:heme A synthase